MVVHLLWIINQSGQLITKTAFTSPDNIGELGANPDMQLTLSSVLFSTCGMSQQLTPNADPLDSSCMTLVECEEHNIHVYETPTAVKFVLFSDNRTMECTKLLKELHALYAEFATKNPFHTVDDAGIGQPIRIPAFTEAIRTTVAKYQRG
ncbi:hypothetical protein LSCM4_02957 [Leishmania orientalis]|uniref:Trafficking protein particle complex subunit n=1 Tax=Leishmania orientalis TaxID=2249476 RepID=A0A836FVT7_9TRYP|nr:hypothetical protein LSCM4_02957 [Leishmania orientalis]